MVLFESVLANVAFWLGKLIPFERASLRSGTPKNQTEGKHSVGIGTKHFLGVENAVRGTFWKRNKLTL